VGHEWNLAYYIPSEATESAWLSALQGGTDTPMVAYVMNQLKAHTNPSQIGCDGLVTVD